MLTSFCALALLGVHTYGVKEVTPTGHVAHVVVHICSGCDQPKATTDTSEGRGDEEPSVTQPPTVQRGIEFAAPRVSRNSGWLSDKVGMIPANDRDEHSAILEKLPQSVRRSVPEFEEGHRYYFIFAGATRTGRGRRIEVREVWRQNDVESEDDHDIPRPGGKDVLVVFVDLHDSKGALDGFRSPLVVVSVKDSDILNPVSGSTDAVLLYNRVTEQKEVVGTSLEGSPLGSLERAF